MNPEEIEELLEQVASGAVRPRAAFGFLINAGTDRVDAEQMIFTALGGSDLVEVADDGRERYVPSGKFVRDVQAAMVR